MRIPVVSSYLIFNDYPDIEEREFQFFLFRHVIAASTFSEYLMQYACVTLGGYVIENLQRAMPKLKMKQRNLAQSLKKLNKL